jgi:hypothetical protein
MRLQFLGRVSLDSGLVDWSIESDASNAENLGERAVVHVMACTNWPHELTGRIDRTNWLRARPSPRKVRQLAWHVAC